MNRTKNRNMLSLMIAVLLLTSCGAESFETNVPTDPLAKELWHDGKAEITSYKLEQARYGEMHEGQASMIFVTEDFSKEKFDSNIPRNAQPQTPISNVDDDFKSGFSMAQSICVDNQYSNGNSFPNYNLP